MEEVKNAEEQKSSAPSTNQNLMAALAYFLGFVTGIIFLLVEKNNKFIRFHAMQSTITFGGLFVVNLALGLVPVIGTIANIPLSIAALVVWILLMIKAYQGQTYKLPYIGDIAEKQVNKTV